MHGIVYVNKRKGKNPCVWKVGLGLELLTSDAEISKAKADPKLLVADTDMKDEKPADSVSYSPTGRLLIAGNESDGKNYQDTRFIYNQKLSRMS